MNISENCYQWLMNMHDFSAEEALWNKLSGEEQAQFEALRKQHSARLAQIKKMEEDNQYFLSAFNAIPLPVAIKDANAKFLLVNEEYKKVVRMNQTDYQGLDVTHLAYFSDEDREVFYENCKYAIDQSAIVQQEFSLGLDDEQRNYVYWLSGFETESRKKGLVSIYYDATFFQSILNRLNKKVVDLEQEQQNIIKNSALDPLTGAYNRNVLAGFLEEAFKEASEKGRDFCLLMLDIDYFKAVNDTFGHLVGDQVLQLLVMLLQKTLRDKDYVVRFGGEEFIIILHNTVLENAYRIAERIRHTVETNMVTPNHKPITVSIGLVSYREGEGAKELLQRVDENLYRAKTAGRNMVVPQM